jgi:hypothetical protein
VKPYEKSSLRVKPYDEEFPQDETLRRRVHYRVNTMKSSLRVKPCDEEFTIG